MPKVKPVAPILEALARASSVRVLNFLSSPFSCFNFSSFLVGIDMRPFLEVEYVNVGCEFLEFAFCVSYCVWFLSVVG